LVAACDAFNGPYLCSFNLQDRHETTIDQRAINQHGACPAFPFSATFLCSGQAQLFPEYVEQTRHRMSMKGASLAVHGAVDF
jgi:hypothetical protein